MRVPPGMVGALSVVLRPCTPRRIAMIAALGALAATTARSGAAAPRAIGRVTQASGVDLYVKRSANAALSPLRKGDTLYLHDIIAAGPGSRSTIALLPEDVSLAAGDDVLYLYKQLSPGRPEATAVGREFGIAVQTVRIHKTLVLRRSANFIYVTLAP
jgi:hypothetical protein